MANEDQWEYMKWEWEKFIIILIYDDILLASYSMELIKSTKGQLSNHIEMKDMRDVSFLLDIKIKKDQKWNLPTLS